MVDEVCSSNGSKVMAEQSPRMRVFERKFGPKRPVAAKIAFFFENYKTETHAKIWF